MSNLLVRPFGVSAEYTLRNEVGVAKGSDPLAPVTVCGPSPHANLSLRRRLGRDCLRLPASGSDGLLNVRLMPFPRVAELLGSTRLAGQGKRLLTDELKREFLRLVAESSRGVFDGIKTHPNTVSALDATFRDLRESSQDELDNLVRAGERASAVVNLYRAYLAAVTGFYDDVDVMRAAANEVAAGSAALDEVGYVILYLPRDLGRAEEAFLHALADRGKLTVILGVTGDEDADAPTLEIAGRLSGFLGPVDGAGDVAVATGTVLLNTPDPEDEIRAVVRRINRLLLEGEPLHRMAILYRSAQPYALLAHEQLAAADLPHNGAQTTTLAQSLTGATVLGLMRLLDDGFAREEVIEWLRGAPIREAVNGDAAPSEAWARIARAAGVVKGLDQWKSRLEKHCERLAGDKQRRLNDDEDGAESPQVVRIEREIGETERLISFIGELGERTNLEGVTTWDRAVSWAHEVLHRYLGSRNDARIWTPQETEDYRTVIEALDALRALDSASGGFRVGAFRGALERKLTGSTRKQGKFGAGVFVGSLRQAVGAGFDRVFIVGMHEGAFPPRPREDPLLSEAERLGAGVRSRMGQLAEDRRDYLAVLASSPSVTLVCSRSEPRAGREQLPCPWYLESASSIAGEPVYSGDILAPAGLAGLERDVSFHAAIMAARAPASAQEYDLGSLLRCRLVDGCVDSHPLLAEDPAYRGGIEATVARMGSEFTKWDGRLVPSVRLAPTLTYPISPSSVQTWARCPFQYLLSRILRVAETERPEESADIRGKDRGDVYHQALEQFFNRRKDTLTPDYEWTPEDRDELCDTAQRIAKEFEIAGIGEGIAWKAERIKLRRTLNRFLDQDARIRNRERLTVASLEYEFGSDAETAPGVTLEGGKQVRFRGKIDRVDVSESGVVWVWDYKSGQKQYAGSISPDCVDRGKLLQLPVYALAARDAKSESEPEARYWFISEPGKDDRNQMGYTVDAEAMTRFKDVLKTIVDGIGGGAFPARPGEMANRNYANCGMCAYDRVCHPDRARNWERKRESQDLAAYTELAEGEPK